MSTDHAIKYEITCLAVIWERYQRNTYKNRTMCMFTVKFLLKRTGIDLALLKTELTARRNRYIWNYIIVWSSFFRHIAIMKAFEVESLSVFQGTFLF